MVADRLLRLALVDVHRVQDGDVKIMATGLGIGILLDATIIRALLVPSLVLLFGRLNWWFPRRLARLLAVGPSREVEVSTPVAHAP